MPCYTRFNSILATCPVTNKRERLFISDIKFSTNAGKAGKHLCLITDKNNLNYLYGENISYLRKTFTDFHLLIIKKGIIINLNYVSENRCDVFSYRQVIMQGGISLEVSVRLGKQIKQAYKSTNIKCFGWRELLAPRNSAICNCL